MVFLERPLIFHGFWTPRVYIYMSFLVMWLIGKVEKGLFQHLSLSTFHNWWLMISEGFVRKSVKICQGRLKPSGVSFLGLALNFEKKDAAFFFCISEMERSKGWKLLELPPWSFLDLLPRCCGSAEIQEMLVARVNPKEIAQKKIEAEDFEENWKQKATMEMQEFCLQSWGVFCKLMIFLCLVFTVVLLLSCSQNWRPEDLKSIQRRLSALEISSTW